MEKLANQILNSPIPTRLVVGNLDKVRDLVETTLQSRFCLQQSNFESQKSCFCTECRKIKNLQHPFLLWLCPEKDYSVDDMDAIFDKTRFALDDGQSFFFVLDKAQNLNSASANKILKVLEEPPVGYNFILLTDNANLILPTILSRSFVVQAQTSSEQVLDHQLLKYFAVKNALPEPVSFDQELKKLHLSDTQSTELCQTLMEYFIKKVSACCTDPSLHDQKLFYTQGLQIIQKRLKTPPASGSSGLFWKLLYLDFSIVRISEPLLKPFDKLPSTGLRISGAILRQAQDEREGVDESARGEPVEPFKRIH
ncbi:MAG: polymerase III, gamma/tau subunit protein [candidate division TM6 bacterium GW2011_GWF2_36_6]|nr:MAG: polymerase III, gamma/tau subunit protein [candidate division TM6 bacterium GW2011_GWF2_36_6]